MNKLIFISNSLADIGHIKAFAKKNNYIFEHYSKEEWRLKIGRQRGPSSKARHLSLVSHSPQKPLFSSPTIDEVKERAIHNALIMSRGNVRQAAITLGVGRATLYRKVQTLNIDLESIRFLSEEKEYQPIALKKAS